jgi:hypothetical protein
MFFTADTDFGFIAGRRLAVLGNLPVACRGAPVGFLKPFDPLSVLQPTVVTRSDAKSQVSLDMKVIP